MLIYTLKDLYIDPPRFCQCILWLVELHLTLNFFLLSCVSQNFANLRKKVPRQNCISAAIPLLCWPSASLPDGQPTWAGLLSPLLFWRPFSLHSQAFAMVAVFQLLLSKACNGTALTCWSSHFLGEREYQGWNSWPCA